MDKVAEQSAPQESEVRNEGARSKNYMARFLTQTAEAFDTTKPFLLGSPEPLGITPDKLQILDRYTLDYATNYWIQGDRKAMTHEQKLQEFASKWANAITKRYALPKEGEAVRLDDLEDRKKKREVLRKLGLDPQNMSADAVRKYHDENFAKGRDVNGFIGRVRQSLSPEEMRAHLDDIEFVAGMFDRGTAKDIRALIELDLEQNKDEYAKRADAQGIIRSDEEKRRLQELAKYLKPGNNDAIKVEIKPDAPLRVDVADKADEEADEKEEGVLDIKVDGDDTEDGGEKKGAPGDQVEQIEITAAGAVDEKDSDLKEKVAKPETITAGDLEVDEVEVNIPTKEFPKDAKLYGQEGDNMRIVISDPVLTQINEVLKEMSWREGDFKERGAVFIGKKYKDLDGRIWTDVVGAFPFNALKSGWGSITFDADFWTEANDIIDHFLNVDKEGNERPVEEQLEIVGWIHTHPPTWEGVLSGQDDDVARSFIQPWQFAYVYGAGLGQDTPVDVSEVMDDEKLGKLFAFFSTGGVGVKYGRYNKHKGFYTRPKTQADKMYETGESLPNGKKVDDLVIELEDIMIEKGQVN